MDWGKFYEKISAKDWPDCPSFQDIKSLPKNIQDEIFFSFISQFFDSNVNKIPNIITVASSPDECKSICNAPKIDYFLDEEELPLTHETMCGNVKIHYHPSMECGGIQRAPMFLKILETVNKKFDHCLEWCAGPGFIGYTILDAGMCNKLDLADIWKPALLAAEKVQTNYSVKTWHIRKLSDINPIQQYDLIVGNPPWFSGDLLYKHRTSSDTNLEIIRQFFLDAKKYLRKDGIIILVEGQKFTGPNNFLQMIENADLEMSRIFECDDDWHWFMEIKHKD